MLQIQVKSALRAPTADVFSARDKGTFDFMDKALERQLMADALFDVPYRAVATTERPDLQVLVDTHSVFGVEVTEVFEHDSHARLLNIPNYLTHLASGGRARHKDDLTELAVTAADSHTDKSSDSEGSGGGVTLTFSGTPQHFDKIAVAVESKSALCDTYEYVTHGFALVIADHIPLLFDPTAKIPARMVLTPKLRRALFASSFFEIYLLPTVLDEYPRTRLMLKAAALYEWACVASSVIAPAAKRHQLTKQEELSVWAGLACPVRPRRLGVWLDTSRCRVYFGRTYLEIRPDGTFRSGQDFTESQGGAVPIWPRAVSQQEHVALAGAIERALETETIETVLFHEIADSS